MRDSDKDLEELERLLGHAKADYRALRHRGNLAARPAKAGRTPPSRRYAIAASMLVAVAAIAFGAIELGGGSGVTPTKPSRLAISRPAAIPLSLRPAGDARARLSIDRSRLTVELRLPRRPTRSGG